MYRRIAHLLILLVLFTHSTMAMDVHTLLPHDSSHSAEYITDSDNDSRDVSSVSSTTTTNIDPICVDGGGHCSHHQAHTSGLLLVNSLVELNEQSVLLSLFKSSLFIHTQAPLLRPPKG